MTAGCGSCGRAKAGRDCPLLGEAVCSRCCGEMRAAGRDCSAACEHRQASVRRARERLAELTAPDIAGLEPLLRNMRLVLVRTMRGTEQSKWLEAVGEIRDRFRAGQSGLMYEHHSADPRVDAGARELWSLVERHREGRDGFVRVGTEELKRALRVVSGQLESGLTRGLDVARLFTLAVDPDYARGHGREEEDWRLVRTPR